MIAIFSLDGGVIKDAQGLTIAVFSLDVLWL